MEDYVSLSEVAEIMEVHPKTVRRWIKSGRLKAYKPGREYRIPNSALRAFYEESEAHPKGNAPQSWRHRLRELPNLKQEALLRASQPSGAWVDGLTLSDLKELKGFCISNDVTPNEVFEELVAQAPELPEISQRRHDRVLQEIDDAVRRGRGEDTEKHA